MDHLNNPNLKPTAVCRTSNKTGIFRRIELNIDPQDMVRFERGVFVQDAFPYLSMDERIYILTGVTPEDHEIVKRRHLIKEPKPFI